MEQLIRRISWRRGFRTAPLWLAVATLSLSGCLATKGDIQRLQFDVANLQARQDSLYRDLLRQDRILLDSLKRSAQSTRDIMSDLAHRITQVTNDMKALQALIGQTQQRLIEQRAEFERMQLEQRSAPAPAAAPTSNNPEELYMIGMTKFNDESYSTARLAFEELLHSFPEHPRAVDARYHLAETYYEDQEFDRAMLEMDRIVEMYPNHARARQALWRAGFFAEQKKDRTKALAYYRQLTGRFPGTDEARLATQRIQALSR